MLLQAEFVRERLRVLHPEAERETETQVVGEVEVENVREGDPLLEGLPLGVEVMEEERHREGVEVSVSGVAEGAREPEAVGVGQKVPEREGLLEIVPERLPVGLLVTDPHRLIVGLLVSVDDRVAHTVNVLDTVTVRDSVVLTVEVVDMVRDEELVNKRVPVRLPVGETDMEFVGLKVAAGAAVATVRVPEREPEREPERVSVTLLVRLNEGVAEKVANASTSRGGARATPKSKQVAREGTTGCARQGLCAPLTNPPPGISASEAAFSSAAKPPELNASEAACRSAAEPGARAARECCCCCCCWMTPKGDTTATAAGEIVHGGKAGKGRATGALDEGGTERPPTLRQASASCAEFSRGRARATKKISSRVNNIVTDRTM